MKTIPKSEEVRQKELDEAGSKEDLFRGKHKSLWSFPRHGVSSSFLSMFLTCREQTRLCYVEGWSPRSEPMAFAFGTCCHWILEQAYQPKLVARWKKETPALAWVQEQIKIYEKKWLKEVQKPTQRQLEQQELCYGMAEVVLPSYFQRWNGDFSGQYRYATHTTAPVKWVSLEEVFELPYEFEDGAKTFIRGRRDGVFRDKRNKLWVFDTKCRSVINDSDILDTLPTDLQQMLYLYATREQKNVNPAGVIMNIVRRPGQRRGNDEKLPDFLERIRLEYAKASKFDHHFIRYEMAVGRDEILDWKENQLDPIMKDVRAWWEGTAPHYTNTLNLITKYGRCGLFLPIVKNEYSMCYQREHAFNELAEV